jgi:dTDP-4-amino-4,6-dideoxygalactose transaminase
MWVRKRIEIGLTDILRSLVDCLLPADRYLLSATIESAWSDAGDSISFLSVRSGFDAMFTALRLPAGSEVLMSALTIPDMPRIVKQHGLVPVPVDLDFPEMEPNLELLRQSITPRTRAIVVAHLFGGKFDLTEIAQIASEHDLLLIEDCAQAYIGPEFTGSPLADISMFSFGPIKTNTALYGALFRVKSTELRQRMALVQKEWPVQSRLSFAKRLLKYSAVKAISIRWVAAIIAGSFRLVGRDHDGFATALARGFAGGDFFRRIQVQSSGPLLKLLHRRLSSFDRQRITRRIQLGKTFVKAIEGRVPVMGSGMLDHSFWVLPILVRDPVALMQRFWRAGFDATTTCSLRCVENDDPQFAANDPVHSRAMLERIILLPFSYRMPEEAILKMAEIVREADPISISEVFPARQQLQSVASQT